ncbi:GNAT family N-acetyltransferase [Haloferula sargassicola]|uniref:N-acetyltransferase domain-containing protein n=1 Tax=Haloferula sargassicola TaxID=490096 RepID=A0ABP9URT9_9BACT
MSAPEIRLLEPADHLAASGLLVHLNPDCPTEVLLQRFRTILAEHDHYVPVGAFVDGRLVGFAGVWIATKIWCGKYLEIDNFVVHPGHRSEGIGGALMDFLETLAKERGCNLQTLDAWTTNHASHRLYHRRGFEVWGFHFVKPLGPLDQ